MHLSESNISWIFSFLLIRSALSKQTSCRLENIFRCLNWKSIQRALKKDFRNSGILWSFAEIERQNSGIYFDPFFFFLVFLQLHVILVEPHLPAQQRMLVLVNHPGFFPFLKTRTKSESHYENSTGSWTFLPGILISVLGWCPTDKSEA